MWINGLVFDASSSRLDLKTAYFMIFWRRIIKEKKKSLDNLDNNEFCALDF